MTVSTGTSWYMPLVPVFTAAGRPIFNRELLAYLATMEAPPLWPDPNDEDREGEPQKSSPGSL